MTESSITTQIEDFFSQYQAFSFKEADTIIFAHAPVEFIYYLKSGVVKQRSLTVSGGEASLNMFKAGAFFPLIWAVKEIPTPYDFVAVTNGNGWKAPKNVVIDFLKTHGEVTFDLVVRLLSGLEGMSRKLDFALQHNAVYRISEAILTLAYRFGNHQEIQVMLDLHLTHQDLAEMTGLTRETVTRTLKHLTEAGLVNVKDHILMIPSVLALEESIQLATLEQTK